MGVVNTQLIYCDMMKYYTEDIYRQAMLMHTYINFRPYMTVMCYPYLKK
jgi:hypothetical protein